MPPSKPAAQTRSPGRRPRYVVDPTPAPAGVWVVAALEVVGAIVAVIYGFGLMIDASTLSTSDAAFLPTLGASLALLLVGMPLLFTAALALVDGRRWSWMITIGFAALLVVGGIAMIFVQTNRLVLGIVIALAGVAIAAYLLGQKVRDYFAPEAVKAKAPRRPAPADDEDEEEDEE
ncbi:MAG TPA: hypothetical protein VNZ52_07770 [Candidatus Thermoplasmatota archaeon]|nr:hypothetical protein [Candidatus Thermoplasmatota archaeon]